MRPSTVDELYNYVVLVKDKSTSIFNYGISCYTEDLEQAIEVSKRINCGGYEVLITKILKNPKAEQLEQRIITV